MNALLHKAYIFGSAETCRRIKNFQQYHYDKTKEGNHIETIVLLAGIISSMKYDFSGEWFSVENTIAIKLTEANKNIKKIRKCVRKYNYK